MSVFGAVFTKVIGSYFFTDDVGNTVTSGHFEARVLVLALAPKIARSYGPIWKHHRNW